MRLTMRTAMLGAAAMALAGCSYFGDDKPTAETASARPVGKLNTECARLQPLFGPEDTELSREKMNAGLKLELAKWDKDGR